MQMKDDTKPAYWPALRAGLLAGGFVAGSIAAAAAVGVAAASAIVPVAMALACLVAIGHHWKTQLARALKEQSRTSRQRFAELDSKLAETQGLVQLGNIAPPFPLPFGGDFALTADAAAVLTRQVLLLRPRVVMELGSGVSTVLVARLLQNLGAGRVISLEHDPAWAAETRRQIHAVGLDEFAMVVEAPLREQSIDGQTYLWYDAGQVPDDLGPVDLLIVDGPPQWIDPKGLPRYPALPRLLPRLSERAELFVDDYKRPPEQEMVRLWLERFPGWKAQSVSTVPGTCLLSRTTTVAGAHTTG
jgi:hypothetical protein